jgi:hypothetical protein
MNKQTKIYAVIGALVLLVGGFFAYQWYVKSTGPDLQGWVNEEGNCVSREGLQVAICCLDKDAEGNWIPIPCEDTIVSPAALLTTGGVTYGTLGVMYGAKITNPAVNAYSIKTWLSGAPTVATTGGSTASIAESDSKWAVLLGETKSKTLAPGASDWWSMNIANPIDLSKIADGKYKTTITASAKKSVNGIEGVTVTTVSKDLLWEVQDEVVSFSLDVSKQ